MMMLNADIQDRELSQPGPETPDGLSVKLPNGGFKKFESLVE